MSPWPMVHCNDVDLMLRNSWLLHLQSNPKITKYLRRTTNDNRMSSMVAHMWRTVPVLRLFKRKAIGANKKTAALCHPSVCSIRTTHSRSALPYLIKDEFFGPRLTELNTCKTVSPRNIISFLVSSTIKSCIMNHFSLSPPPPAARRWAFQTVFSLSRVVPATDSWVTFAIRSYKVVSLVDGASTSALKSGTPRSI